MGVQKLEHNLAPWAGLGSPDTKGCFFFYPVTEEVRVPIGYVAMQQLRPTLLLERIHLRSGHVTESDRTSNQLRVQVLGDESFGGGNLQVQ